MKAVIALGANIGEPKENLDLAIALLKEASDVQLVSSYYTTAPVGGPEQPDYLNAVCIIESDLPAMDLLSLLHGIEKSLGRERTEHWGPRTIDLDLIQYGGLLSKLKNFNYRIHVRTSVVLFCNHGLKLSLTQFCLRMER